MSFIKKMVSVVMPVYNSEKYISRAIDSILGQTYTNLELIIVDDCPTDKTMLIINQYNDCRIRIIHNGVNRGIAYSRNVGIENSRGEYIALMDNDDISMPDRFMLQVKFLNRHKDIDIVGGQAQWIDEYDNPITEPSKVYDDSKLIKAKFLLNNVFWNCEVMFRKSIIDKYRFFYEDNMYGMEDYHFWIRYSKVCNMSNVGALVLQHRNSETTETNRVCKFHNEERRILFNDLRRLSMELSGIELNDNTYAVINSHFNSTDDGCCKNIYDAKLLYDALRELVSEGYRKKLDFADEIAKICHLYFIDMMKKSNLLWWQP